MQQESQKNNSKTQIELELVSEVQTTSSLALPSHSNSPTQQILNPESNIVLQSLAEEDEAYRTPSFFINPVYHVKNQEENCKLAQKVREIQLFPIFEDDQLARSSINYFLYLEFYHIAIRLFFLILMFSIIIYKLFLLRIEFGSAVNIDRASVIFYAVGGVTLTFLLKYYLKREERRLLDQEALYNFQWSEDLFSLLLTNIPKECTKLEIQQYLQDILQKNQASANATVRDIIFVHDYYEFTRLSKSLKSSHDKLIALQTQPSNQKIVQERRSLQQKIISLTNKLDTLQKEIQDFRHFRGKAIVIFNTIEAKALITQHFSTGKLKALLIILFKKYFSSYYLKGQRISSKEIPEPHNLLIENLHYPLRKRIWRTPLAYFASSAVFLIAIVILGALSGWKLKQVFIKTASLLDNELYSYGFAILTMLIGTLLGKIYQLTQSLFIHSSALQAEKSVVNYNIYVTFLVYVLLQGTWGYGRRELWFDQLVKLALLYVLKRLVMKGFAFLTLIKIKKIEESEGLLTGLIHKVKENYSEFDFAQGLNFIFPLIFMGLAFIVLHPFVLLPIFIASLYLFAVIDKYRMLRQCNLYSTKSARFMLVHFWIYSWAPFLAFYYASPILQNYQQQVYPDAGDHLLFKLSLISCFIGLIFSCCCCGKSLDQRVAEKFFEKNSQVEYASVSKEFSSFYQREDYSTDPLNFIL